jgi:hypothetical protein
MPFEMVEETWNHVCNFWQTFGFLVQHISRIIGFQIEIEKMYSLARIFNNLKRCLQLDSLCKWFFVNENKPNDLKVVCKVTNNFGRFDRFWIRFKVGIKWVWSSFD